MPRQAVFFSSAKTQAIGYARRMILSYLMAFLLVFAVVNLAQSVMANHVSDQAEATMEYWSSFKFKWVPLANRIRVEDERLKHAIDLSSHDPIHHERLGQLYLWELATQDIDELRRQELHDMGLNQARTAVAMQPGWATSWLRLLVWKSSKGELDKEFEAALDRATTLGTWQVLINHTILTAVLPVWENLNAVTQGKVLMAGKRALSQSPLTTLHVLQAHHRLADVCQLVDGHDPIMAKHCMAIQEPP